MSSVAILTPTRLAPASWPIRSPETWEIKSSEKIKQTFRRYRTIEEMPSDSAADSSASRSSQNRTKQSNQKTRKHNSEDKTVKTEKPVVKVETARELQNDESQNFRFTSNSSPKNSRTTPSPSVSPKSPTNQLNRTSSSLSATPPHPAFTPPKSVPSGCFSPVMGGIGAAMGGLGHMAIFNGAQGTVPDGMRNLAMPRNCSDLIRSMAAKYNNNTSNNSTTISNLYNNQALNGFHRPPVVTSLGFPHTSIPASITSETNSIQTSSFPKDQDTKSLLDSKRGPIPSAISPSSLPSHLLTSGAFPGLPATSLMDISSTQVLLNMVRSASNLHQQGALGKMSPHEEQLHKHLIYQQHLQQRQQDARSNQINNKVRHPSFSSGSLHVSTASSERGTKRPLDTSSPLDLSSSMPTKFARTEEGMSRHLLNQEGPDINVEDDGSNSPIPNDGDGRTTKLKGFEQKPNYLTWSVDDVYDFVNSIDICAEYAESFRDQRIDGACLSLLSESHLTGSLKMKLGPALKLRSFLAARSPNHTNCPMLSPSSSCNHCSNNNNNINSNNNINKCYSPNSDSTVASPTGSRISSTSKCYSPSPLKENGGSPIENRMMAEGVPSTSP